MVKYRICDTVVVVSTTILFQCPTEIATTFCIVEEDEEDEEERRRRLALQSLSCIKSTPLAKTRRERVL
jgi:hypothetical protein